MVKWFGLYSTPEYSGGDIEEGNPQVSAAAMNKSLHSVHSLYSTVYQGNSKSFGLDVDVERVQNAINETGSNLYGVVAIDVWYLMNDGQLHHFGDSGINWISPIYKAQLRGDQSKTEIFNVLEQVNKNTAPTAEPVGVGLAGNAWQRHADDAGRKYSLEWRKLNDFVNDPDQMPSMRLKKLAKAFGKYTGIPFNIFGEFKGVVLYFVRTNCDERAMSARLNANFLHYSANYIGASSALSETRSKVVINRKEIARNAVRKLVLTIKTAKTFADLKGLDSPDVFNDNFRNTFSVSSTIYLPLEVGKAVFNKPFAHSFTDVRNKIASKWRNVAHKSLKPPLEPPPGANMKTVMFTMIGVFVTLMVLSSLNKLVAHVSNNDLYLILGPFGAILTLQFALTAAPTAQPRNCIYGMILSLAITMLCKYILYIQIGMPQWIMAVIACSLAIGSISKTGLVHPPAGAASILFATSTRKFGEDLVLICILLVAEMVAIFMATIINNLSDKRQYPMYWAMFRRRNKNG